MYVQPKNAMRTPDDEEEADEEEEELGVAETYADYMPSKGACVI